MTYRLVGNETRCCGIVVELLMIAVLSLAMTLTPKAQTQGSQELLTNGDFETGTFDSWTVVDQEGSLC